MPWFAALSLYVYVHGAKERVICSHIYLYVCMYVHTETYIFYIHMNIHTVVKGNILNKFCRVLKSQLNNNDCFLTKK